MTYTDIHEEIAALCKQIAAVEAAIAVARSTLCARHESGDTSATEENDLRELIEARDSLASRLDCLQILAKDTLIMTEARAEAPSRIRQAEVRVEQQRETIAKLQALDKDTTASRQLLATLEHELSRLRDRMGDEPSSSEELDHLDRA